MLLKANEPVKLPDGQFVSSAKVKIFQVICGVPEQMPWCVSYDTESQEVEQCVVVSRGDDTASTKFSIVDGKVETRRFVEPNSYAEVDGVRLY